MNLDELRLVIDQADNELIAAFKKRMEVSAEIGKYKKENGMQVFDSSREQKKLLSVSKKVPEEFRDYTVSLYSLLMDLSKSYQSRLISDENETVRTIKNAIDSTPQLFPASATVACQGVEGAYSSLACKRLFRLPETFYFPSFEAVFSAIENGLCEYGVIPVENSTAGSVNQVYDLMMKHNFRIVRSVRLKIDHNLLANRSARLEDIKEIYSHEQAIGQCGEFLQKLSGVTVHKCANTAVAAKMVAESGRTDIAAISSRSCASLYNLNALAKDIQDTGNNSTRFICISKNLEIYPGADRTSLMMILPHHPGSLYKMLGRFYSLGINLNKLESRPIPERNFEFMFYFDLDTPVYSPAFMQLMNELPDVCEEFGYLGSYSEVI